MLIARRAVCAHRQLLLARTITGTSYDHGNIKKIPGFRKPPVPHEDLLIENDGRYPPHLKIDMDHPENWPKHYPPFYESRRPAKWPILRAVFMGFALFQAVLFWTNPTWLVPWGVPEFPCFRKDDNWVTLEEHDEHLYPWQQTLIEPENRYPEVRRAMGYSNFVLDMEED